MSTGAGGIVAVVLAGGEGRRLLPLTQRRAKPAMPFGGKYRIIDFVLTNLVHSNILRIHVLTQYQPYSLIRHLARGWTPWRTLLLDDPVQHIDDFRALHLIEVLAAFRLAGKQIVCAVEDQALAELLCRRLLSTSGAIGKRYDLDIGLDGATTIVSDTEVPPMPAGVLRSRSAIHAVG